MELSPIVVTPDGRMLFTAWGNLYEVIGGCQYGMNFDILCLQIRKGVN